MANIKIAFLGTEESKTNSHELECFINSKNHIYIGITTGDDEYYNSWICLDKSTAIKLAKTLRTEINKLDDE